MLLHVNIIDVFLVAITLGTRIANIAYEMFDNQLSEDKVLNPTFSVELIG